MQWIDIRQGNVDPDFMAVEPMLDSLEPRFPAVKRQAGGK